MPLKCQLNVIKMSICRLSDVEIVDEMSIKCCYNVFPVLKCRYSVNSKNLVWWTFHNGPIKSCTHLCLMYHISQQTVILVYFYINQEKKAYLNREDDFYLSNVLDGRWTALFAFFLSVLSHFPLLFISFRLTWI